MADSIGTSPTTEASRPAPLDAVDADTKQLLEKHGFADLPFETFRQRLRDGSADVANRLSGTVEPPQPGDITRLPQAGTAEREALANIGRDAIRRGEVGCVVLAGGMATRFGGVVKASVEAVDGKTFLDLKAQDIARAADSAQGVVPLYLMTSFNTDTMVRNLANALSSAQVPALCFCQFVSVRLTATGDVFADSSGRASAHAAGHGDLTFALRRSGVLKQFMKNGGKYLLMSNVDNVAATLDPAVIGAHIQSGASISVEVVDKVAGDKGGAPARVDGTLQIVESFRFPSSFDQDSIPVFNTNTFVISANAIDRDFDLTWFAVNKKVDGQPVVQFERLVGELTAFLPCHFLRVERDGPDARFQPVKDPDELERRRDEIRAISQRGY